MPAIAIDPHALVRGQGQREENYEQKSESYHESLSSVLNDVRPGVWKVDAVHCSGTIRFPRGSRSVSAVRIDSQTLVRFCQGPRAVRVEAGATIDA
jgi:hypothetical protein